MGWAVNHITKLNRGEWANFRPYGHSMKGLIESGDSVSVVPKTYIGKEIEVGTIVLCTIGRREYLHKVLKMETKNNVTKFLIGNNRGGINGWITREDIHGMCLTVNGNDI